MRQTGQLTWCGDLPPHLTRDNGGFTAPLREELAEAARQDKTEAKKG